MDSSVDIFERLCKVMRRGLQGGYSLEAVDHPSDAPACQHGLV